MSIPRGGAESVPPRRPGVADEARVSMYKAAYDEGKRKVDDQLAELDSMRARSVQFLAFVGSATAFLVAAGLRQTHRTDGFYVVAGLATFVSVMSIALVTSILTALRLFRHTRWDFRINSKVLVEEWIDPEVGATSEARFFRDIALHYHTMATKNDPPLQRLRGRYIAFLTCGSFQVILWAALVWGYA